MFQTKIVEKIKTHILYSETFFFFENRSVYEVMWKNIVEGAGHRSIWHIRTAWIPKATNTHTQVV